MKLFALFDWDKTVRSGGYVLFDLITILVEKGIMNENIENEMNKIKEEHKEGKISYEEFAQKAVQIYRKIYKWITNTDN